MEATDYQFGSDSINLADANINESDCTSFLTDHEENVCKRLISDDDFQTIDHEQFSEVASYQDLNSRTKEIEGDLSLAHSTSPTLCSNDLQYNKESKKDFKDCRITTRNAVKVSSTEVDHKPPNKKCAHLIRLEPAHGRSKQKSNEGESDVDQGNGTIISVLSQASQEKNLENEIAEPKKNQAIVYSEESGFQFLTPKVPDVSPKQIIILRSSEESFDARDTHFKDLMQPENMNIQDPSSAGCIELSNVSAADFVSPRTKELSSQHSTINKSPVWVVTSNKSCDMKSDSTRANSSSSFPDIQDLSQNVSSDYQSSTPASDSDIYTSTKEVQRFLTADNKVVCGYKDNEGEFHFYSQTLMDRENHNEKERMRRSRVSEACACMRSLVPGLSEKSDKATVFEHAAIYIKFLREKFSAKFDRSFYDKYFQGRR